MEKEFETIFNSVNDGILIYSLKGRFLEANRIMCDDLGYQKDELLQMTAMDITPPEFRETIHEQVVGVLNRGGGIVETMSRCKDGSLVPIELNIRPIEYKGTPAILAVARNITERKQMEEALRKSEASLSNAQRIANLGNWDWDIANNELYWSDEIYRIFGVEPKEFGATYEAFLNSIHPDDRMFVLEHVNKAISENKTYSIDHRILLPDGSERIVHEQAEVTFNETGQAIRMVGTVQDITKRKQAEDALQKSEEKYRNLTESFNELIYRADPETLVATYVNQPVERIYGHTVEEWLNTPNLWEQTIYPDDRERVFAEFTELQTKLESGIVEYRIIKKDKTIRWVQDHVSWEKDQQGKPISMNGIIYDISESREADKLLRQSEEKFRTIFESANDAIYLTNLNGQFLEVNRVACDRLGYSRSELLQMGPKDIDSFDDAAQVEDRINQMLQHGHLLFETVTVRKDGSTIPVEVNIRLIDYMGGKAILGISRDITKHKQAVEAMLQAKMLAEDANRTKSEFIMNMSHELRTPLNSIIGFTDVICSENFGALNEYQKKYTSTVLRNGKNLLNIINDIISISNIETGKMKLHINEFFVSDAIDEVEALMIPIASQKNIDLTCNIDIETPTIKADTKKFKQILYNLVSNAIKFTGQGGSVTIGGKISEDLVHISVKDSGIGISPED